MNKPNPDDVKLEYLGKGVENYVIQVTREDGVKVRVLIPLPGTGWYDEAMIRGDHPSFQPFGLNLVVSGHYA